MARSTAGAGVAADDGGRGTGVDRRAEGLISFLRAEGASRSGHGNERTLLDHLIGTYEIVRRWNQPPWLQHAALMHSVYGTDVYHRQLLPVSRRADLREIGGDHAEHLAYLFSVTPRKPLFAGTYAWARGLPTLPADDEPNDQPPATRAELDGLVLLHMANLAEQAQAKDGSPGRWLVRVRELGELLIESETVTPPLFVAGLAAFEETDESLALRAYRAALAGIDDREAMTNQLALAAAACPVVPEPCIWQAHLSRSRGDVAAARSWAGCALARLRDLGTAWDKRLTFDDWLELAQRLQRAADGKLAPPAVAARDPWALLDAVRDESPEPLSGPGSPTFSEPLSGHGSPTFSERPAAPPDEAVGMNRFHRYVEMFSGADSPAARGVYPDLESQPWYKPSEFPLVSYLESHYEAIRNEILGLDSSRFHRESERIKRSGEWDVAFLYERGRRREEVCQACPVTARGIESYPAMRTVAGLIYASRMRAGAHIQAHRGPTNLRVRCHLAIKVPDGDCAIRVGDDTRRWHEGQCLVFQDYFEHEAWNHAGDDRIVLIVDMWHPGLSATEVCLLQGLHSYAYAYARQLNRYWSSNARAAADAAGG